ncbi:MAG: diguanylate cyclase [Vicinamibacterales bacterium]
MVELRERPAPPSLAGRFSYLVDDSARLTLADVRSPASAGRFRTATRPDLNLGFTSAAAWLRLDLQRAAPMPDDWMLTFDYPLLDRIEVFDGWGDGTAPVTVLGDRLPFAARIVPHRTFAVPLRFEGDTARLYIRVTTESSMQVRPVVTTGHAFFLGSSRDELVFGGVYGVMALMALYNLFLFFALWDRTYLVYVAATGLAMGFIMAFYGHAYQYLWPGSPWLANRASPVLAALWCLATPYFARLFLTPERYAPVVRRAIDGLIVLGAAASLVACVAPLRVAMMTASATAVINALLLLSSGAIVWAMGHAAARFFTLAWVAVGFGTVSLALSRFGLLPDTLLTKDGAVAGLIVEIVLLSFALSDKYRIMTVALASHSRELEERVRARTAELAEANDVLARLSQTDPLTGLANRRRFDEALSDEIKRHRRAGVPLSLVMVDVDYFKRYNDRYGHQDGDACLRRVAEAIESAPHRAFDLVARYGGEEFVVLLPETDRAGALRVSEHIRTAVRQLALPHMAGEPPYVVTVSAGVGTLTPGHETRPDHLVALADAALYDAKRRRPPAAAPAPARLAR